MPGGKEKEAGQEFDDRIADTELCPATTGFPPEEEPGKDWDVVQPTDGLATGTGGSWGDDGLAFRNPVYTDVEKTAEAGTGAKEEDLEYPRSRLGDEGKVGHGSIGLKGRTDSGHSRGRLDPKHLGGLRTWHRQGFWRQSSNLGIWRLGGQAWKDRWKPGNRAGVLA